MTLVVSSSNKSSKRPTALIPYPSYIKKALMDTSSSADTKIYRPFIQKNNAINIFTTRCNQMGVTLACGSLWAEAVKWPWARYKGCGPPLKIRRAEHHLAHPAQSEPQASVTHHPGFLKIEYFSRIY
jgi:hypothetical protein